MDIKQKPILAGAVIGCFLAAFAALPPARAQEKGLLEIKSIAEVERTVINEKGEKEVNRVPAAKVFPGETVIYTNSYRNVSPQPVDKGLAITNPIPDHMTYVGGSAVGEGTVITFSVDGGKTFDLPQTLTVTGENGRPRPAAPEDYTTIRWTLQKDLGPDKGGEVGFRAVLQ